jgi:hypothetical protein
MKLKLLTAILLTSFTALQAAAPDLSTVNTRADLDSVIATTTDVALKNLLTDHAADILAAASRHPHVEAVIRTIESAPGQFAKVNTTPEPLKKATGGDIALFDTLTMVHTGILNGHPHANRTANEDPYDGTFFEHLGHIPTLESVTLVVNRIEDSWLPPLTKLDRLQRLLIEKRYDNGPGDSAIAQLLPLANLPGLKSLGVHYFSKVTEAGLEQLAVFKNLESFSFRSGSKIPCHAFAKFDGWTNLKGIAFHGNEIDDEGLGYICEKFPNLESLNLIHSRQLTDASAEHLLKLTKLKSLIINGPKITAAWLRNLNRLPLGYVMLNAPIPPAAESIAHVKSIPTLRKLNVACDKLTDADLASLAGVTQLEELTMVNLELPDARLPQLQAFAHLKSLTLVRYGKGYPDETHAKVKALLPKVDVKFVK